MRDAHNTKTYEEVLLIAEQATLIGWLLLQHESKGEDRRKHSKPEQWAGSKSKGRQQPIGHTTTWEIRVYQAPLVPAPNEVNLREDQQVQE